jgi:hypothetical protein
MRGDRRVLHRVSGGEVTRGVWATEAVMESDGGDPHPASARVMSGSGTKRLPRLRFFRRMCRRQVVSKHQTYPGWSCGSLSLFLERLQVHRPHRAIQPPLLPRAHDYHSTHRPGRPPSPCLSSLLTLPSPHPHTPSVRRYVHRQEVPLHRKCLHPWPHSNGRGSLHQDEPDPHHAHGLPALHQEIPAVRPCILYLIPHTLYPIPYILYPEPYTMRFYTVQFTIYPIPYTLYPIPYTLYPIPYTLYPIPYTLYPIPYTLYSMPYTLYPIPCTLYPIPYALCNV